MLKKLLAVPAILLVLTCLFFLQKLTDGVNAEKDPTSQIQAMEKDTYNGYGLEGSQELSDVLLAEIDDTVCYEDRVFQRFSYEEENLDRLASAVRGLRQLCPEAENLYVVPIPSRVLIEEGYESDREAYEACMKRISEAVQGSGTLVDVWSVLKDHAGEYIFYRTEDSWTARGAYYGSAVLCESLGITPHSLDAYNEYMYEISKGTLLREARDLYSERYGVENETAEKTLDIDGDAIFFYLLQGGVNIEKCVDGDETVIQPAVSQSRNGRTAFVGDVFDYAVVMGDESRKGVKDETLLLIADSRGNILAPFLANYYKSVYVVNMVWDKTFLEELPDILREYKIKSVVLAQDACDMGVLEESRAISGLMEKDEGRN